MLRDLIEEASSWDPEPKPASLRWASTYDSEEKSDMNLGTTSGCYTFPFEHTFKILGCALNRQGKTYDAVEERMQSANRAFWKNILINKSIDVPWKIVSKTGGPRLCSLCLWEWKLVVDHTNDGKDQRMGNQDSETLVPFQKTWRWNVGGLPYKNVRYGQKDLDTDGLAFFYEKIAESVWWAMGWVCDEKSNAWLLHSEKSFSGDVRDVGITFWTRMMKKNSENHTRWKH